MALISQTLSMAGGNLARPTRFTALIAPPPIVTGALGGSSGAAKVFDVLCKQIKVPDVSMQVIDILYKGHKIGIPGRVNQEQTIEITMYLDERHSLRKVFHDWISGIDKRYYAISSSASASLQQTNDYFGNIIIKARDFDETRREPMNYLLEGCYPISVSGPAYDSGATGETQEFTVTFQYWRFLSGDTAGGYDDLDNYLDKFGTIPDIKENLSAIGRVGGALNVGNEIIGVGTGIWNSIGTISDFINEI